MNKKLDGFIRDKRPNIYLSADVEFGAEIASGYKVFLKPASATPESEQRWVEIKNPGGEVIATGTWKDDRITLHSKRSDSEDPPLGELSQVLLSTLRAATLFDRKG